MKRRDILIILGVIIAVNLIIFLILKAAPEQNIRGSEYEISGGVGPGTEKNLKLDNISALDSLYGEMVVSTTAGWVADIFETNLKIHVEETKDFDNAKLEEFFNKNKIRIDKELHLSDKNSYINLINSARKITCSLDEFDTCKFLEEENFITFECIYANGEKIQGRFEGKALSVIKIVF